MGQPRAEILDESQHALMCLNADGTGFAEGLRQTARESSGPVRPDLAELRNDDRTARLRRRPAAWRPARPPPMTTTGLPVSAGACEPARTGRRRNGADAAAAADR